MTTVWKSLGGMSMLALAACSAKSDDRNASTAMSGDAPAASQGGVTREEVLPTPTASPTPIQAAAMQTQPGPKGNNVALNKVAVTGDILTVAMTFTGTGTCCVSIPIDNVSVIDDATSQRLSVLKDNTGKWMANPIGYDPKTINLQEYNGTSQVYFKFPAPPPTTKTVSITVPGVAPFDAVPVTR